MTTLSSRLEKNWRAIVSSEFDKGVEFEQHMGQLEQFLQRETAAGRNFYPKNAEIFTALNLTALGNVKVVIIGQDPYYREGQAHGLCFSVPKGVPVPPSLKNIYKELEREFDIQMPRHGDLTGWAKQGVLLLNATLTVEGGKDNAGSHQGKGWEEFTDAIIRAVSENRERVVFLLWGRAAQKKGALIDCKKHCVLETSHPSGLSAYRGFLGCNHFKTTNDCLIKHGLRPVDWQKI